MDFLILIAFGVSIWAQFKVKGNFSKWSDVPASSGLTGAEVARLILDRNGLYDVPVELVPGTLTDHYDPIARAVRLSEPVYYGRSIAAVSVAAHEVGHAVQHQQAYGALVLRHRMFPIVNLTSGMASIPSSWRVFIATVFVNWFRDYFILVCCSVSSHYIAG